MEESLMAAQKIRVTLELSSDLNDTLDAIADTSGSTKSEVLRKAIALVEAATKAKAKGRELAIIDSKSEKVVTHIVGL